MDINIGLSENYRKTSAEALSRVLAGTFILYVKTHNYHWNVTGTEFAQLHQLFEKQYNELFLAVDTVAERIRALGYRAPATFAEFEKLSPVKEELPGRVPEAEEMVRQLMEGHEAICRTLRESEPQVKPSGDEASINLLADRLAYHEKTAWMLRASLSSRAAGGKGELKKVASR